MGLSVAQAARRCLGLSARRCLSTSSGKTIADMAPALERLKLAEARYVLPAVTPMSTAARHLITERLTFALVEADGGAVGLLNERNLLRYAMHAGDLAFFSGREKGEPTIDQWMTSKDEMLSVRLDDTLEHAASLLFSRGIWRHLPVLDYWNRLHSIIDLRDVVTQLIGQDTAAWKGKQASDLLGVKRRQRLDQARQEWEQTAEGDWREQLQMYLLRHAATHTVSANKSVEHAARQALDARLTFLVAVEPGSGEPEDKQRVVGLVNERSFLSFCAAGVPGSTAPAHTPVSSIMTPLSDVLHVSLSTPAHEVIDLFFSRNVRHVPVIDGGRLQGVLSARDVLRGLFE